MKRAVSLWFLATEARFLFHLQICNGRFRYNNLRIGEEQQDPLEEASELSLPN